MQGWSKARAWVDGRRAKYADAARAGGLMRAWDRIGGPSALPDPGWDWSRCALRTRDWRLEYRNWLQNVPK
jgi:hypothetical protein